ncbi:nuclease-related domain-containing protein [Oceanobacillus sp. J11TS1]|uniref:nuclease-related domain-containing protein n=1 Tax=Oceanobacillus sp. J11TS1 TaxID=2807191 RepID=UPI001B0A0177|nr:nuclease-related domain-containing protein [Oceanobacillus sp. J11TS1]GIO25253.1 hypothetical protein J11TS1_38340 [Oceanobacillus sp. J11TS1]
MLIKKREKPAKLISYEVLLDRLPKNHRQYKIVLADYKKYHRGFLGEKSVDYYLSLLKDDFTLLQDISLMVNHQRLQIDSMIITSSCIYIIEIKNLMGKLTLDTTIQQITQTTEEQKERGYQYPIHQLDIQIMKLKLWLEKYQFRNINVEGIIVISDPETILEIKGSHEEIVEKVIHAAALPHTILEKEMRNKNMNHPLQHYKMGQLITRKCEVPPFNILRHYDIPVEDLQSGVKCPNCGDITIYRIYLKWKCPTCHAEIKGVHKKALADYHTLISPEITVKEAGKWLHIHSRHVCKRIFNKEKYSYNTKTRTWKKSMDDYLS